MADMTPKATIAGIDARDGRACSWHGPDGMPGWCSQAQLVPQHRQGGMGGRRGKNRLANVVWLCSLVNGLIESDSKWQRAAVDRGIKIPDAADPAAVVIEHAVHGAVLLKDDGTVVPVETERWGA